MKQILETFIQETARRYAEAQGIPLASPLEHELAVSKDADHGDFASNIAFKISRLAKQPPRKIAENLIALMQEKCPAVVRKLELGGGGFINFYLTKNSLGEILFQVRAEDGRFGNSEEGKGKKVLVEFVSANPTGPLTIAHGRQAVAGDCLVRILRAAGFEAKAEYYLNDAGKQVRLLGKSLFARYAQKLGRDVPVPEEGYQGLYLTKTAGTLALSKGDSLLSMDEAKREEIAAEFGKEELLKEIFEDLEKIGVRFDSCASELSLYKNKEIERAFDDLQKRGHLYEKDGALWFRSTTFGDDKDRVVRKSTGELTYLAPDIAYHRSKFERGFQRLVDLLGPDHHGYIGRIKAACQALGHNPEEVEIRIVQLVTLYRNGEAVRMSKRAGEFETLRDLVEDVGPDVTRFFFMMRRMESPLDFDLDLAKQKSQENPVYYLQYAHARIAGILRNAEGSSRGLTPLTEVRLLSSPEEAELIKWIYEFPGVVASSARTLEPYRVADYLRELAVSFHKFYTCHRVLTDDQALTNARLLLVEAARIVLRNGLRLLGISQPETM